MNIYKKKPIRSCRPQTTGSKKTLDTHHNILIENIRKSSQLESNLKDELRHVDAKIALLEKAENKTNASINELIALKDKRVNIKESLSNVTNDNETLYLTNTASILFQYYDLLDNNKSFECDTNLNGKRQSILKYFMGPNKQSKSNDATKSSSNDIEHNRGSLLDKYMQYVDKNYVKSAKLEDDTIVCNYCESENVTIMNNDGFILCNDCHCIEYIIVDHDKPSYKDPPKEISYFAYKRSNHFLILFIVFYNYYTLFIQ